MPFVVSLNFWSALECSVPANWSYSIRFLYTSAHCFAIWNYFVSIRQVRKQNFFKVILRNSQVNVSRSLYAGQPSRSVPLN